jgi:HK97 family phage portal protein
VKLVERVKSLFGLGAGEGQHRDAWGWSELGNAFVLDPSDGTGWQRNLSKQSAQSVAIVYACVMLYARAISQCVAEHKVLSEKGGHDTSTTSPASRVLRYPNEYETFCQFVYNIVASLLFDGEALALKVYDDRRAVSGLHRLPRGNWSIHVDPETKAIFYGINPTDLFDQPGMLVPSRDVVHFRMHCPRHPLIGESPVKAAAMAVGINVALNQSQLFFFNQMNRPSGVLSTDNLYNSDQMKQLRAAFDEQSKRWATGGVPILAGGLKFQPVNITQADSQLIEQQKLSAVDVARVYGVPMTLLSEGSGPQGATEALISSWLSMGLGSVIETIERTLDRAFDLKASEHIQLDPAPLLRVDFAGRIEGYVKAVQGGIMAPGEVRAREQLDRKPGDDSLYMQRQMTSLDVLTELGRAELQNALAPPPQPAAPPAAPPKEQPEATEDEKADPEITKALVLSMIAYKRKAA